MHRFGFLLFIPILLGAADLKVDHATVAGSDLRTMMDNLAAVGIHCEYGGPHNDHITEMALTSFPDGSYLELIAPQSGSNKDVTAHVWIKQMQNNAGPSAWAIRSSDLAGDVKRLQAAGVTVSSPQPGGRKRPDGKRLEWETAQIGEEPRGTFFPFIIQDLTPRQDRVFLTGKPTTKDFIGIARVVIAVRDLRVAVQRYRDAFALPSPIEQVDKDFGAHLALFTGTPVVLAAPLHAGSWLAARLEQFGEGPCAFILGARKAGHYKPAEKTYWAMADISWFDTTKLGWHLGFE
ncbi:MAG: VOC family protein [Acidobacteriaceae bacterium]|nr:VOC family protein [Acidobacteriaceae bacterium]MBV9499468.1 VOC family protein [Acidobacteriaceae bacterium]